MDISDSGVVYYASDDGSQTYKDRTGATKSAQALTTAAFQAGAELALGATQDLQLFAYGALPNTGSVKVRLLVKRIDKNNPSLFRYAPVQLRRQDTGDVGEELTITAADLIDPDGNPQDLVLSTTGQRLTGKVKPVVKAVGAPGAGDVFVLGMNAW